MIEIRDLTFDDYAQHFIARERAKGETGSGFEWNTEEGRLRYFSTPADQGGGKGKFLDWFTTARWTEVELDQADLQRLMHWYACRLKQERLADLEHAPRTLLNCVARAIRFEYFHDSMPEPQAGHWRYHQRILQENLELVGLHRLTIRSVLPGESAPWSDAVYSDYLHDGFGRSLPYLKLVLEGRIGFKPVIALRAEFQE